MSTTIVKKFGITNEDFLKEIEFYEFAEAIDVVYQGIMLGYFVDEQLDAMVTIGGFGKNYVDWMQEENYHINPIEFIPNQEQKNAIQIKIGQLHEQNKRYRN